MIKTHEVSHFHSRVTSSTSVRFQPKRKAFAYFRGPTSNRSLVDVLEHIEYSTP